MDTTEPHNESPAEEKKSDNPEHINIKVVLFSPPSVILRSFLIRVGR